MKEKYTKKNRNLWVIILCTILMTGVIYMVASAEPIPYRVVTKYPMGMLLEEVGQMHECAECHESQDFHTCNTCHNDHGSAVLADLNFYSTVHLTGDIPQEKLIPTNHIFLDEDQKIEKISVIDFLKQNGVDDFYSITFVSGDGGFTTIEKDQLSDTSYLLPYEDGVRFTDENLHESTWIKGINKIIVKGNTKNLIIAGNSYSLGELMLLDTVQFTVEQAQVMLKSEEDGVIRKGYTAERLEGIAVSGLLNLQPSKSYRIALDNGNYERSSYEEMLNSKLVLIGKQVTLVFPDKARNQWLFGVQKIEEIS